MKSDTTNPPSLASFAWLSIAAALVTIALKACAYLLTGSVGLLSDVLESIVNLAAALLVLATLIIAIRPADESHAYGHSKAEYFASGAEGTLIMVAAISIGVAAAQRLITPKPLEQIGLGLGISVFASLVNLLAALFLLRAGRQFHSISLEANAKHLLTDVWTSAGVVIGVGLAALTGWQRLDPVVALLVAVNIVWSGGRIVYGSVAGLMDTALPAEDREAIRKAIEPYMQGGIECHAIRTRRSGMRRFVSLHVLVPGSWTVGDGHHLLEKIEASIGRSLPNTTVFTHLEPLEHPDAWDDAELDR